MDTTTILVSVLCPIVVAQSQICYKLLEYKTVCLQLSEARYLNQKRMQRGREVGAIFPIYLFHGTNQCGQYINFSCPAMHSSKVWYLIWCKESRLGKIALFWIWSMVKKIQSEWMQALLYWATIFELSCVEMKSFKKKKKPKVIEDHLPFRILFGLITFSTKINAIGCLVQNMNVLHWTPIVANDTGWRHFLDEIHVEKTSENWQCVQFPGYEILYNTRNFPKISVSKYSVAYTKSSIWVYKGFAKPIFFICLLQYVRGKILIISQLQLNQ